VIRRMLMGVLLACVAIAPSLAQTATKLEEIIARGVLRVGLSGDYRPFSAQDRVTNQYSGIDVEMANSLAATLGVKLVIVPTTWRDLLKDVNSGQFDIGMGGITITMDRQRTAFFSTPVMRTGKAAIVHCSARSRFPNLLAIDRAGVRVMVNPGGTNEQFARANLKNAQITIFPDNSRIFEEVVGGRADVVFADVVEIRLQQKLNKELCAINADRPFDFGEVGYLLPRDTVWKQYVDQWVHISLESGTYRKIVDTYLK
jgi:cyclohexadienyl dehydratase